MKKLLFVLTSILLSYTTLAQTQGIAGTANYIASGAITKYFPFNLKAKTGDLTVQVHVSPDSATLSSFAVLQWSIDSSLSFPIWYNNSQTYFRWYVNIPHFVRPASVDSLVRYVMSDTCKFTATLNDCGWNIPANAIGYRLLYKQVTGYYDTVNVLWYQSGPNY